VSDQPRKRSRLAPLTDRERESTVIAFASGKAGYEWGRDALVDQVLTCGETNTLWRPGGAGDQTRGFMRLLFTFHQHRRIRDLELLAKAIGGR
jgi:hypothetical protein